MIVSSHQPYLFGHVGYWAKIASSDVHIVVGDIDYRPQDYLGKGVIRGQTVQVSLLKGECIKDVKVDSFHKVRKTLEQLLRSKACSYAHRLDPLFDALQVIPEKPFLIDVWMEMAYPLTHALGITPWVGASYERRTEPNTFERNCTRVSQFAPVSEYLVGPATQEYLGDAKRPSFEVTLHLMNTPNPMTVLELLVTEEDFLPKIKDFSTKPLLFPDTISE